MKESGPEDEGERKMEEEIRRTEMRWKVKEEEEHEVDENRSEGKRN